MNSQVCEIVLRKDPKNVLLDIPLEKQETLLGIEEDSQSQYFIMLNICPKYHHCMQNNATNITDANVLKTLSMAPYK